MTPHFHLSIDVRAIDASVDFFARVLKGKVAHRDPSGYVNIDLYGTELTLKSNPKLPADLPQFHFGINMARADFEALAEHVQATARASIVKLPVVVDAGTPLERKKMYLKCPTGYLIELKGY